MLPLGGGGRCPASLHLPPSLPWALSRDLTPQAARAPKPGWCSIRGREELGAGCLGVKELTQVLPTPVRPQPNALEGQVPGRAAEGASGPYLPPRGFWGMRTQLRPGGAGLRSQGPAQGSTHQPPSSFLRLFQAALWLSGRAARPLASPTPRGNPACAQHGPAVLLCAPQACLETVCQCAHFWGCKALEDPSVRRDGRGADETVAIFQTTLGSVLVRTRGGRPAGGGFPVAWGLGPRWSWRPVS